MDSRTGSWVAMAVMSLSRTRLAISSMISRAVVESELAGRLVGEQQDRLGDEGAGDGDSLLLTTELARDLIGVLVQAHLSERRTHSLLALGSGKAHEPQRDSDILCGGEDGQGEEALEDIGDLLATKPQQVVIGHCRHLATVHHDAAGINAVEAPDGVQQGRLARARPASDREELPTARTRSSRLAGRSRPSHQRRRSS